MKKVILSTIILFLSFLPAMAFDDHYGSGSAINAGFRLSIPFGPAKKQENKVNFGFQMGIQREYGNTANYLRNRQIFKADLISLNFSENGFKSLNLAGRETLIYRDGVLKMANFKENKGRFYGGLAIGVILGGAAVAGGVILIVTETD
ncbi:hypothetical protein MNBD_ALPHA01-129 [hydrothermal vent metagenome]|uniref:Uncharacterized protein n=1 Tax=hydrothermal vent metagenome TaxID=652676 RepID=A0A3B0S4H7_9ZZZZ